MKGPGVKLEVDRGMLGGAWGTHRDVRGVSISTDLGVRQDAPDRHCPLAHTWLVQLVVTHHHRPCQLVLVPDRVGGSELGGDKNAPAVPPLQDSVPTYPVKQWAAVRTQECSTSTPPHISSPWSRTDTSQGQAPRGAMLPPMIRPWGAVELAWGPPRCPQLPGGQSWGERGVPQPCYGDTAYPRGGAGMAVVGRGDGG